VAALCVCGWLAAVAALPVPAAADLGHVDGGDPHGEERAAQDELTAARLAMVKEHIAPEIESEAVVKAMETVPRHLFVRKQDRDNAYRNTPLPIVAGQTISQPAVVAIMTYLLKIEPGEKVLEVGTGSGYQAAVLAEIVERVCTVEIRPSLYRSARERLARLRYSNVECRLGDGHLGWAEFAPFDAILVTAAPPHDVPPALIEQLAHGGRLVVPVGERDQQLIRLDKHAGGVARRTVTAVRFVPLVDEAGLES
jgi:protein-L-isoaspartate(D-aspartate) O-methyltransferase